MFESITKERRTPKFLFFEKEKKINNNKKGANSTNHNSRYSLLPQLYEQELGDSQEYVNDRRTTHIKNQLREDKVIQSKLASTKLKHTWDLFPNTNTKSQNNKSNNMIKSTNLKNSSLLSKFNNLSFKNSRFKTTNFNSFSNSLTFQKKENKNYEFNSVGNEKNINQKELSKKFSFNNKEQIENQYQFSTETKQYMKTYHNNNSNNNVNKNNLSQNNLNEKQFPPKYNNQKINLNQRNNYKQNYYNNSNNNSSSNNNNDNNNSSSNGNNNRNYYYNENEVNRFNPPRNNNETYSNNNQNLYYNHQIKEQNNPKLINNFSKDLKFERELDQQKFVRPYHFGSWWMAKPDISNNNLIQQQEQQFNNNINIQPNTITNNNNNNSHNNYNYNYNSHNNNNEYINNNNHNQFQQNEQQPKKNERKEHPLGEYPNRALFVRNIDSNIGDEKLFNIFGQFGEIKEIYSKSKIRGFVLIKYYDIRHSMTALEKLQGEIINGRKVDIHYSIPKENPKEEDQNQGTVVCFNLDETITNEQIFHYFSQVGQVKEIRSTPNKLRHRFIEYYDIRDANRAIQMLNKSIIKNREIKVELSRAGGIRSKLISNYRKMKNTSPKNKKTNYRKTRNNINSNSNNNNNIKINNSNININININNNNEYKTKNQNRNQYISNNFETSNKNQENVTLINQKNYNSYNNQNTPKTFNNKYKKYNNNNNNTNMNMNMNMNIHMNMNKQNTQSSNQPKLLFKIDKNDQNKYYSEDSINYDNYNYTKQTSSKQSFHLPQTDENYQVNQNSYY
ncbi:protein mei2-like [Anaeramoeba flamelloides]|uniref:Protein mei2-like n=1 Tax=Anaeramoeba flamelloides TaxID=1746091 RepID=A0AAV7ZRY6_9EUKA|nr:protein mei2-like [Anaeramoeba flamelloides]